MKRIKYPPRGSMEFAKIVSDYKKLFAVSLPKMETDWGNWKVRNHVTTISETVEELLCADVDALADVYDRFLALHIPSTMLDPKGSGKKVRSTEYKELDTIFKYTNKYDVVISDFFNEKATGLHITTCYYCELAYINTYNVISASTHIAKRQFDIDHFLPKTKCPIVGLSLFNFVPSCQVCNSRIKLMRELGDNVLEKQKFNPAGEDYKFDENVKIRLRMWRKPSTSFKTRGNYYLYFRCQNGFRKYVDFFHLEERYEFHKCEALRLLELKAKYPQGTIKRIAELLGKSVSDIREDIFHKKFLNSNDRCFAKLTKDILK